MSHENINMPFGHRTAFAVAASLASLTVLSGVADPSGVARHHEISASTAHAVSNPQAVEFTGSSAQNSPLPPSNLLECSAVSPANLAFAQRLLSEPTNPDVNNIRADIDEKERATVVASVKAEFPANLTPFAPLSGAQVKMAEQYFTQHAMQTEDDIDTTIDMSVARRTGMTIYDPRPYTTQLEEDIQNPEGPKLPIATYIQTTRAYLGLYGIKFEVAPPDAKLADGLEPSKEADLNTLQAKTDILQIIEGVSRLPQQYIDLAGIREVDLASNPNKVNVGAYALMASGHGTVVVNITNGIDAGTIRHEFAHELQDYMCGGWNADNYDSQIKDLNKGQAYSGAIATHPSIDTFVPQQGTQGDTNIVGSVLETQIANAIRGKLNSKDVAFISNYSETNIVEDEAEMFKTITSDNWAILNTYSYPLVQQKAGVLLGRIASFDEPLAEYFAETALKQDAVGGGK